jgi:hypothetical protein
MEIFFSRFRLSWVMPNRIVDLLACWETASETQSIVVWKMMSLCLLWCLQKEMNDRNFEDRERTLEELESFFFYTLFIWKTVFISPLVLRYHDFLIHFSPSS